MLWERSWDGNDWYTRKKLANGKTALVAMQRDETVNAAMPYFYVALAIVKKRKQTYSSDVFDNRITGDGGLEGLLFAKQALIDFEGRFSLPHFAIAVAGSDGRRQRAYERYLTRLGYRKERIDGQLVMVKRINRKEAQA
ncbi:hypothetical protein [Exiguobacterium sp. s22]|uniref:hypothetical protein n=1 Tax=Exiguobacterium sp. s22 TaxID=2751272 RepID=UPI001BEC4BA3|nr:hypothetical protein [Exiguobacterium sp. s22]